MKHITLLFAFFLFVNFHLFSQEEIKTYTAYKIRTNYNFSSEWQYLSSDLYLMNGDKFAYLLNQITLNSSGGKKKKRRGTDYIQSLFIKAKIKDIKFFGGDIVYPIYSFSVQKDKDYTTQVSSNVEVIRLLDNLPLISTKDYVDAEISGQIITNNRKNEFLKLVANQLQNISRYSKPNIAVFDLVGELGKFIESKTTGKQYKFSSTIRLYEDQDFNRRLHSVNIFVFIPNYVQKINVSAANLTDYITKTDNPKIDQKILRYLISFRRYPMMIVVNYKSRYLTQSVIGDQVDYDYIAKRRLKVSNAYQSDLINEQTYIQENELIKFLELFAQFKLDINNYTLNKQNKITDDFSKNIFVIMHDYRLLLDYRKQKQQKYNENTEFKTEFDEKYQTVLNTAKIYLAADQELKNIKDALSIVENNDLYKVSMPDSVQLENNLKILHSIKIPEDEKESVEANLLISSIVDIENRLYSIKFQSIVNKLNTLPLSAEAFKIRDLYSNRAGLTNCEMCRQKLNKAINDYTYRYTQAQRKILIDENEHEKQESLKLLFDYIKKKNCVETNLKNMSSENLPDFYSLFELEYKKFNNFISQLSDLFKSDVSNLSNEEIIEQNKNLQTLQNRISTSYQNMSTGFPSLCTCE